MRTPGDSAMLCRFAHVQSVTFFAHAVVCTVILRRGRGSATFGSGRPRRTRATSVEGAGGPRRIPGYLRAAAGPGRPRHTRATSAEGAGGTAGPGRASSRRAEPQARGADGERAGGPDGTRTTGDAATTSVSEGGGRAWPPTTHPCHQCGGCCRDRRAWPLTTHPRHQCGGCRRAKVHSGCLRAAAGPGRASRSTTPSRRLACGDLAGGPPPSGTKTGSPGQESTANPGGERAGPTAPRTSATQPRPRRYRTRARHSTEYRARSRL